MMFIIIQTVVLLISIILHEIAHGLVALYYGDPTAKVQGRLTMNPFPHIDLVGSVLLPACFIMTKAPFFIGWAKPVPVNTAYFSHPERHMGRVALAGPVTNFSLALIASALLYVLSVMPVVSLPVWAIYTLIVMVQINLVLGLFNLMPIPPLDGSRIIMPILPTKVKEFYIKCEPYGLFIVFISIYLGLFNGLFKVVLPQLLQLMLPVKI